MSKYTKEERHAMLQKYAAQLQNAERRPNVKYWETVNPTYIENWPDGLLSYSIPTVRIPITQDVAVKIGTNIPEFQEAFFGDKFGYSEPQDITFLEKQIDEILNNFPDHLGFIRLGSRSPKDSFTGYQLGFKGSTGKQLLSILVGCSERIYEDIDLAIMHNYNPSIYIRQWIDIPDWSEFRCFIKNKELIGISQYNYHSGKLDVVCDNKDVIQEAIIKLCDDIMPILHIDDVVVDVFITTFVVDGVYVWEAKLLEINPFGAYTDPCLFNWISQGDGTLLPVGDSFFMVCLKYKQEDRIINF